MSDVSYVEKVLGRIYFCFWGFVLGMFFSMFAIDYTDKNWGRMKHRVNASEASCKALSSTPSSFDRKETTCENGVVVSHLKVSD